MADEEKKFKWEDDAELKALFETMDEDQIRELMLSAEGKENISDDELERLLKQSIVEDNDVEKPLQEDFIKGYKEIGGEKPADDSKKKRGLFGRKKAIVNDDEDDEDDDISEVVIESLPRKQEEVQSDEDIEEDKEDRKKKPKKKSGFFGRRKKDAAEEIPVQNTDGLEAVQKPERETGEVGDEPGDESANVRQEEGNLEISEDSPASVAEAPKESAGESEMPAESDREAEANKPENGIASAEMQSEQPLEEGETTAETVVLEESEESTDGTPEDDILLSPLAKDAGELEELLPTTEEEALPNDGFGQVMEELAVEPDAELAEESMEESAGQPADKPAEEQSAENSVGGESAVADTTGEITEGEKGVSDPEEGALSTLLGVDEPSLEAEDLGALFGTTASDSAAGEEALATDSIGDLDDEDDLDLTESLTMVEDEDASNTDADAEASAEEFDYLKNLEGAEAAEKTEAVAEVKEDTEKKPKKSIQDITAKLPELRKKLRKKRRRAWKRFKKNKKAQWLAAVIVMLVVLLISGFALFRMFTRLQRLQEENKVIVKQAARSYNNANYIYVENVKQLNGQDLKLNKLLLDEYRCGFFFERSIPMNVCHAYMQDDLGNFYPLDTSLWAKENEYTAGSGQTVLWFDGLKDEVQALTITIYDSLSKDSAQYEVDLENYGGTLAAKYLNRTKGIRTGVPNLNITIEDAVFSSAVSTIIYKMETKGDFQVAHGYGDSPRALDFMGISSNSKAVAPMVDRPELYKIDDNMTIGRMDFQPLRTLDKNAKVTFRNLYRYHEIGQTIHGEGLFSDTTAAQQRFDLGTEVFILERIRQIGEQYVLVYHMENKESGERVAAHPDIDMYVQTYTGIRVELTPEVYAGIEGGDILYKFDKPNSIITYAEPQNVYLEVNSVSVKLPDVVTDMAVPEMSEERSSKNYAPVRSAVAAAFEQRLNVKSGKDAAGIESLFEAAVLENEALASLYEPDHTPYSEILSGTNIRTVAQLSKNKYLAIVDEAWVGITESTQAYYSNSHEVIIEQKENGFVIISDMLVETE